MGREQGRTCAHCGENFTPDARNARHQRYCSQAACRTASKRASQAKWLSKEDNRHYHCGPAAVARVQAWRHAHPGYSQRNARAPGALAQLPAVAAPDPVTASLPIPAAGACVSAAPLAAHAPDPTAHAPLQEHLGTPLQDVLGSPLQDILATQPAVLIGLIAHLWDSALQEDIAAALTRLVQLGRDICGGEHDHHQAGLEPGPVAPGTRALQLARSSPGT